MQTLTNPNHRVEPDTCQSETIPIIMGCYRLNDATWEEAMAMALNGTGYVRDGSALRLIHSEAFEQWVRS